MHELASMQRIKEVIPEPWKMALIQKAIEKGVTYKFKCVFIPKRMNGSLKTRYAGVDRTFRLDQVMELPAQVASHLWDKFCIDGVAGSIRHAVTTMAPFEMPCFEEVVDENRTDLGPMLKLRQGGVAAQEDLIQEVRSPTAGERPGRVTSEEPGAAEIAEVAKIAPPKPAGGGTV